MTAYLVASVSDVRHAVEPGQGSALCGAQLVVVPTAPWPGSGGGLCRECSRLVAGSSGVPLSTGRRRPGGMG
jgi:hypothetical protein